VLYLNCLASIYFWTFFRENQSEVLAPSKFSKLYNKLLKGGVIFPQKFENLKINENFENDLETFTYLDPSDDKTNLKEEIG